MKTEDQTLNQENIEQAIEQVHESPNPEDVLIATDTGIKITQIDDNLSFGSAFAAARTQLGSGGAFEWRGNVYNTYYKEEWKELNTEEQNDFLSRIDYKDISSENLFSEYTSETIHNDFEHEISPTGEQQEEFGEFYDSDDEISEDEIKVLGIENVQDNDGNTLTVVSVEMEGQEVFLVDVDQNDIVELSISDLNKDGEITHNEMLNISDLNVKISDLEQNRIENSSAYSDPNDNTDDYMNYTDDQTI